MISKEGIERIAHAAAELHQALLDKGFAPAGAMQITAAAMPALAGRV